MKLHIGNLPKTVTDRELQELVKPFGAMLVRNLASFRAGSLVENSGA